MTVAYAPELLGACRVCGGPAYTYDETGPVHVCCARLPDGVDSCPACNAAEQAVRDQQRRTESRRRSARAVSSAT